MAVFARLLLWVILYNFTKYQLGNCGDICKYVTIPVCGDDMSATANSAEIILNLESNKPCQAGTPGKKGPIGPRGYKGDQGPRGRPGSDAQSVTEDKVKQLLVVLLEGRYVYILSFHSKFIYNVPMINDHVAINVIFRISTILKLYFIHIDTLTAIQRKVNAVRQLFELD